MKAHGMQDKLNLPAEENDDRIALLFI